MQTKQQLVEEKYESESQRNKKRKRKKKRKILDMLADKVPSKPNKSE